ncbi:MAG: hypothetical protein R3B95_19190 [Nitrospirales bacterium]|nr:hypothetical protein [Nitrospirales bacterium]
MASDIVTRLVTTIDGFIGPFRQAEGQVKGFVDRSTRNLQNFQNSVSTVGRLLTSVLVTGTMARVLTRQIELGDRLDKTSRSLGIQAQELSNLNFAAERGGVSQETLANGFAQAQKNILDFTRGTGEARRELEAAGITQAQATELLKDPLEAFLTVGDAVNRSANKTAAAMKLLGKSGKELVPVFAGGREELQKLFALNQRLNPNVNEQARLSAELKDRLADLTAAWEGLLNRGLVPTLPVLTELLGISTALITRSDDLLERIAALSEYGVNAGTVLRGIAGSAVYLQVSIKALAAQFAFLFEQMTNPGTRQGLLDEFQKVMADLDDELEQRLSKLYPEATGGKPKDFSIPEAPKPSPTAVADALDLTPNSPDKPSKFAITRDLFSPADPAKARQEILDGIGLEQEVLGTDIQHRLRLGFRAATDDLKQISEEASFQLELDPNSDTKKIIALEAQINARKQELEVLGKVVDSDHELIRLEHELAILRGKQQRALGEGIVRNSTSALQGAFAPIDARLREARESLAIGDLRKDRFGEPLQLPGTRLLRQADIANAERDRLALEFQQTGNQDTHSALRVKTAEVEQLQTAFDNLEFVALKAQIDSFGSSLANAVNTMVQGVLLGTQTIDQLWKNMLRNLALQLATEANNKLITGVISSVGSAVAGGFSGGAAGGGAGPFAGLAGLAGFKFADGGSFVVGGRGGIDANLVPLQLTRGERVTVETEKQQRRGGGGLTVNVNNYAPGVEATAQEWNTPNGRTVDVVIRRTVRDTLEREYGVHRKPGRVG